MPPAAPRIRWIELMPLDVRLLPVGGGGSSVSCCRSCLADPSRGGDVSTGLIGFRLGLLPLVVPLTLLRYNIRRHDIEYLAGQLYFDPHPKELMLRNHA